MSTSTANETKPAEAPRKRGLGWVGVPAGIFLALAALFAFSLSSGDPSKLPSALIGKPAPAVTLPPLAGLTAGGKPVPGFATADLPKGEVAVINYWASWCVPCVQEHPFLKAVAQRGGVKVYGINYKDQTENALAFLARLGNPFVALGVDSNGRAGIEWGVYGMPETFIVDGAGRIAYKQVGPIDAKVLESRILPAIAAAKAAKTPGG
jgi:cytochrome c biogenesis protein CcmG/thiol:disulfide interchange protein DsbE